MLNTQSSVVAKAATKCFTVFPKLIARERTGFCVFWKESLAWWELPGSCSGYDLFWLLFSVQFIPSSHRTQLMKSGWHQQFRVKKGTELKQKKKSCLSKQTPNVSQVTEVRGRLRTARLNSIRLKGKTAYSFAFDYYGRNRELECLMTLQRGLTDPFSFQEI